MRKKITLSFVILLVVKALTAQNQYTGIYRFYELPQSARVAGLGGNPIAIPDNDINIVSVNPSVLKDTMSNQIAVNATSYMTGIKYGSFIWGYTLKERGNIALGIQFLDYGRFDRRDEFGYKIGTYGGNEYSVNITWSKELFKYLHIGAAFKPLVSEVDIYKSYGLAFDLGAHFYNPNYGTAISMVFKNLGKQLKPFNTDNYENLPYDIQLGISTKLKHAPFRFSFVLHHLTQFNLLYKNKNVSEPNNTGLPPDEIEKDYVNDNLENFLRHTIFGLEILPSKSFYLQVGYNFLRRSELKTVSKPSVSGLSFGIGIQTKRININFARQHYHLSQSSNHLSIQANIHNLIRK